NNFSQPGYPHIGHAKAVFLSLEGARSAGGYMRLRMDDTNPEKEKQEFADAIVSDLKWVGASWQGEITYTSDYMDKLYECADELMLKQKAYVCTCSAQEVKKGREKGEQCLCRAKFPEENVHDFRRMMAGKTAEGEAILRWAGDMKAMNTVMRDPTLFRVITAPHYRQGEKYKCWPSYDFEAPIIDSLEGITHAMRSKEYELRDELYFAILRELEMRAPKLIHFSRLSISGAPVSKRLITPLIAEGKVSGYDDPRLPTLSALRRRAISPAAIRQFVLSFGLSKVESEPGWEKLLSYNRKLADASAPRRFFVPSPVKVELSGAPSKILTLKNHPQNSSMGTRSIEASSPLYIPGPDASALADGETFRLKDWCNIKLVSRREESVLQPDGTSASSPILTCEFVSEEGEVSRKVQWVSESHKLPARVLMPRDLLLPDGSYNPESLPIVWGWAEPSCASLEAHTPVQLERFGFATLDAADEKALTFIQMSD
ncbi:MAG: glutamate--tRNA ligase family protein, partial [Candidatus Marsarchaeota archaeon]|nr:glutamate--tRNA ligase family protein [Candidatus Marsarchaeota archaeon]